MASFLIILAAIPLLLFFLLPIFRNFGSKRSLPIPPGPRGLPIIGNLHQLGDPSNLPKHLHQLSKTYGPLMSLRLGSVQALVVSSAEMAKEVLKTNDLVFCSRPVLTGQKIISYNNIDVALSPYNDYWREMRKICTLHLFSSKMVNSFSPIREEEVFLMVNKLKSKIAASGSSKALVNLSETVVSLSNTIISREAFGKRYEDPTGLTKRIYECLVVMANFYLRDYFPMMGWVDKLNGSCARLKKTFKDMDAFYQQLIDEHLNPERSNKAQDDIIDIFLQVMKDGASSVNLTLDHIKAMLMDILLGGTETSAATVEWTMTLLIKNPKTLKKVQQEIRKVMGDKGRIDEEDLPKLDYLKAVIKEALRLFPVVPLLVPRETMARCVLKQYEIPKKTLVYVNAWAIGRDPECWENPEDFDPERFMGTTIDYKGMDFQFIPFGSGRRVCPGMTLGTATVELIISNLLYSFDWELQDGVKEEDIDTLPAPAVTMHRKNPLLLVAKAYNYEQV